MFIGHRLRAALSCALFLTVSACGGSSGSGGGGGAPIAPPVSIANTSLPQYLPEAAGNVWTFTSGGTIRDLGSITLACSCAINGSRAEAMGFYTPQNSQSGILYFEKGIYPNGVLAGRSITYLTGVSTDGGATILLTVYSLDGTVPGLGAMDDAPVAGETFTFTPGSASQASASGTIVSVGGSQSDGAGQIINSIAQSTLQSGTSSFGFGMARGVGFTNVSAQGQNLALASFSINPTSATTVARQPLSTVHGLARQATDDERSRIVNILGGLR